PGAVDPRRSPALPHTNEEEIRVGAQHHDVPDPAASRSDPRSATPARPHPQPGTTGQRTGRAAHTEPQHHRCRPHPDRTRLPVRWETTSRRNHTHRPAPGRTPPTTPPTPRPGPER